MALKPNLCDYCDKIHFDALRCPTAGELQELNNGQIAKDRFPYKALGRDKEPEHWNLGLQSRITQSASTCPMCEAICMLVREESGREEYLQHLQCSAEVSYSAYILPEQGIEWKEMSFKLNRIFLRWFGVADSDAASDGPGLFQHRGNINWFSVEDAFQISAEDFSGPWNGFTANNNSRVIFGGRRRPSKIDFELPLKWLTDCLSHHSGCYSTDKDGFRVSSSW